MSDPRKTALVTGASQGIGAGIVKRFVERGFNVVVNSRMMPQSTEVTASNQAELVDGHIGEPATAAKIVETARSRFRSIDQLVNNAGLIMTWLIKGWIALRSSAVSFWKRRGLTIPNSVEERRTAVMPAGTSPFQCGPTTR
jgi:NAD(P)-dependent dehydrogenase (short-subunit alcohol dehydrogenase family)